MAWDGSGNVNRTTGLYTGTNAWQQTADASRGIVAGDADTHDQDLADAIENCIARDGQNSPSANIPWNSKLITGYGTATARTNVVSLGTVQDGAFLWGGTSGGTANAHTVTLSPAISAYVAGMLIGFIPGNTNTGATTLNANGVASTNIINQDGSSLRAGQLYTSGICVVQYNGTTWKLVSHNAPQITTWSPSYGAATGSTASPVTTTSDYKVLDTYLCWVSLAGAVQLSGGPSEYLTATLPVNVTGTLMSMFCEVRIDSGSYEMGLARVDSAANTIMSIYRQTFANWGNTTASNRHEFRVSGIYRI